MLAKIKTVFSNRNAQCYKYFDWQPLKIEILLFLTYCINIYGIINQHEKGWLILSVTVLHDQLRRFFTVS